MTRKKKATKKTKKTKNNPASLGLTVAQSAAFGIIVRRANAGRTVTTQDVATAWDGKNRSYVYRVIETLIQKGLVKRYAQRYYSVA